MKDCSVTIHNDASLFDGHDGIVHTWIEVNRPGNPPEIISFSAESAWAAGADKPGKFDPPEKLTGRPNDSVTIAIERGFLSRICG